MTVEEVRRDFEDWLNDGNDGVPWNYPTINGMVCTHIHKIADHLFRIHTTGKHNVYAEFILAGHVRIAEASTRPDPYAQYRGKNKR